MLRFPISLLTAAALVEGVILALVDEYQQTDQSGTSSPALSSSNVSSDDLDLEKACKDVVPICSDVVAVLGVSMVGHMCLLLNSQRAGLILESRLICGHVDGGCRCSTKICFFDS
jgi:hypothetical protein